MKFPQEYPLTSHPNTILLVKNSQMRSIEASFKFPYDPASKEGGGNKLEVDFKLP
jgi:hypothetical protein